MLRDSYNTALLNIKNLVTKLTKTIDNLPENENVTYLNEKKNCFVISSGNLGDNWSAEYHSFRYQYNYLIELIKNKEPFDVVKTLDNIILTGKHKKEERNVLKFNPKVIEYLKQIM